LTLRRFKVLSIESLDSVNFIGRLVQIVRNQLRILFGVMGSQEFMIDRFDYDDAAELWDIKLIRRVDGRNLRYEMSIDNHNGQVMSFGRDRR